MAVYLDCNATTPPEPYVQAEVVKYLSEEFGNAGSRTHDFGARAKQAVQRARDQVAAVVAARREDVVFTSGATESNNLAILGLATHGEKSKRKHIVSTQIEHKAVLEPLRVLEGRGFDLTLVPPTAGGWIDPDALRGALRADTLLVSVMHANNETGVLQPIAEIAEILADHPAFLHLDAAQGFGKDIATLRNSRIDLISVSAHKVYGPKGVGALVCRRRGYKSPPLAPLVYGGGQERGLRPGTLPVPLVVGLGAASKLALRDAGSRAEACRSFRTVLLEHLGQFGPHVNGDPERTLPHVVNISFPGLDSEAVMLALKGLVAISNGSACTSQSYEPSHVLRAMGLPTDIIDGATRWSWCHTTEQPDWGAIVKAMKRLGATRAAMSFAHGTTGKS